MEANRLELLHRAYDHIDALRELNWSYFGRAQTDAYARTLLQLSNVGYDTDEFALPPYHHAPDDGYVNDDDYPAVIFKLYAGRALKFLERQIQQAEQATQAKSEQARAEQAGKPPGNNRVFIVHGQDRDAVETIFALLREVEVTPLGFEEARRLTRRPLPYIGDVLDSALQEAQSVLVLFTPDERVETTERLLKRGHPIVVEFQPRPNVLIEAGIALTTHPERTVILEMGTLRSISDLAGRHVVRWREDTPAGRSDLLDRLEEAGCTPNREGSHRWMEVGKKDHPTWG